MSEKGSVYQKGGGGTNFEQYVQCAFLTTLIVQGNLPCIPNGKLSEVAFQTTSRGYETDDLLAIVKSDLGEHRLVAQIKHNLIFSDSDSNNTFRDVIDGFWQDFNNSNLFNKEKDRLLIIKSGLNDNERKHIKPILNWAKNHKDANDFHQEINRIKEKKKYLDIFSSVIKQVNSGISITDEKLWQFLKCVDILEYDFQNDGSVHETYFKNLIRLSKNDSLVINENEIWSNIFAIVSKYNPDGGSLTIEDIKQLDVYKYFDIQKLNPISISISKLKNDSSSILFPLKNTVRGLHIKRLDISTNVIDTIHTSPITIITGKPGVGKSAILKDILKMNYADAQVFVFRADQFNDIHLAHVFSKSGISESIQDILSYVALIPEKLIVIESLEKLLEGDPENAFKQFIEFLSNYPDIKIVATSRKYAVDLIVQKYDISNSRFTTIEIPELNDEELKVIFNEFPELLPVSTNSKLNDFLSIPKYLDFIVESLAKDATDYSTLNTTDFKKRLWNNIIENSTVKRNGIDKKRNDAFLNIAIKRAKKMRLFVEPDKGHEEGIEALERDNVIFKEEFEYEFSPTHDILEDWALVKYIEQKYEEYGNSNTFFNSLGNEPSIRRAFRIWVEENLQEYSKKIDTIVNLALNNVDIDRYWIDELLIAIFKSSDCQYFFEEFQKTLLKNEGALLNKCIHLIRTACKENDKLHLLLPTGSGWRGIIFFISHNIKFLDKYRLSIINLLCDWNLDFKINHNKNERECLAVKEIVIYYIKQVESLDEFWLYDLEKKKTEELISLLFTLSKISHAEITEIINRSLHWKENTIEDNWHLDSFYDKVIEKCLSGVATSTLVKELPDLIIDVAWDKWKRKKINYDVENNFR